MNPPPPRLVALATLSALLLPARSPAAEPAYSFEQARALLVKSCLDCHSAEEAQGELDLEKYDRVEKVLADRKMWDQVAVRVRNGEMPPKRRRLKPLPEAERLAFMGWIEQTFRQAACAGEPRPGPAPLRRLNKSEYRATLRDLLGIHFDAASSLPDDGGGGVGFDNAAVTLFLSPAHAEKYLEAARQALGYASREAEARKRIFVARPDGKTTPDEAARQVLERFAARAYRRPVRPEEVERLMSLYRRGQEAGQTFDEAVLYALQAVLISPHFLFRVEAPARGEKPEPLGGHELASRLSYFLWNSMPDDELFRAAGAGGLGDETVLKRQVARMLRDRKARDFAESFAGQWLGTRRLGTDQGPDRKLFPQYTPELENAMREEPILFLREILAEDRSLLELIDSDWTYADRSLARLYGIPAPPGFGQLSRVSLPRDSRRGGVLTMAGVLAVTSYPNRTSPVLRGAWVMDTILGTPPPTPPPDVPPLPESPEKASGKTVRQRLLIHRANPACASCHERIDPIGFGLENFDAMGRWRTREAGQPIDASGSLPDATRFDGPEGLKRALLAHKEDFIRHLTTRMLGYALGRGLVDEDYCVVDRIVKELKANDYRGHVLVWEIVRSMPFRYRGMPARETP